MHSLVILELDALRLLIDATADELVDNTRTISIKLDGRTRNPEGAWIGYVYGFKDEGDRIRFRYHLRKVSRFLSRETETVPHLKKAL